MISAKREGEKRPEPAAKRENREITVGDADW